MDKKWIYIVVIFLLLLCVGCLGGYIIIEMKPFDKKSNNISDLNNEEKVEEVELDITNGNVLSLFNKAHYNSIGPSAPLYRDGGYQVKNMTAEEKVALLSRQWYPEVTEVMTGTVDNPSYHYELDEEVLKNIYNSFYGVNTYQNVSSISDGCLTLTLDSQSRKYVYDGTSGCGGASNFQVQEEIIKAIRYNDRIEIVGVALYYDENGFYKDYNKEELLDTGIIDVSENAISEYINNHQEELEQYCYTYYLGEDGFYYFDSASRINQ